MNLKSGSLVSNRYEVQKRLGEGGFAVIYQARDLELGREVALKIPKFSFQDSGEEVLRFRREAKLLAQLLHPNIVRVYSIDLLNDGTPLIVMELLAGTSLKKLLSDKNAGLDSELCRRVFLDVCMGLQYAHKAGVVHRDLSSSNVFLLGASSSCRAKLIDFGLSGLFANAPQVSMALTRTGALIGNPLYMSPEACRGEKVNELSDIYSLGCVLYEMLCGNTPFQNAEIVGLLHLHQMQYPEEPNTAWKNSVLESNFQKIALKCMQKEKSKRFSSIDEILQTLQRDDLASAALEFTDLGSWGKADGRRDLKHSNAALFAPALLVCAGFLLCIFFWQKNNQSVEEFTRKQKTEHKHKEFSLEVLEKKYGRNDYFARRLLGDAAAFKDQNNLLEAERYCKRALEVSQEVDGANSGRASDSFYLLSEIYRALGRYPEAERACKKSLEISIQVDGEMHSRYATRLANLAELTRVQGNYREAEKFGLKAVRIVEGVDGSDSPGLVNRLKWLTILYMEELRWADAEKNCRKILSIEEKQEGNDASLIRSESTLVKILRQEKKESEAKQVEAKIKTLSTRSWKLRTP